MTPPPRPPTNDRTPLLAQIDRSLSRSRRGFTRSKSRGPSLRARETDIQSTRSSEEDEDLLVPTTLGDVVEGLDGPEGRAAKGEGASGSYGSLGDGCGSYESRWKLVKSRARYYVPVTRWLPSYNFELFTGDAIAGVTLACLLIPQGISYASALAHLTPISGLYCAVVPAIVYAFFGTCNQLSVGAEAALCLLVGNAIDEIWADYVREHAHRHISVLAAEKMSVAVDVATTIGFQVGVITFALGLFRMGFLDVVLSRALLKGFITAVGVVIFVEQMIGMLGLHELLSSLPHPPSTTVAKAEFLLSHLNETHKLTAMVAFSTLAFLVVARMFKKATKNTKGLALLKFVPEILVGVVISTFLTSHFGWDLHGLQVLGKIDGLSEGSGRPLISSPLRKSTLKLFSTTFPTAAVIAIIGFVDSIVAAKENASRYGYSISPNRELVALGAANIASSFFPGLPSGFGSLTRSRLAGGFGARTPMAGVITAGVIIFSINVLLGTLFYLPKCVLSAIVLLVIYGILVEAPEEIHFYVKVSAWKDMAQFWLTFLLTLFVGVEPGLVSSVAFSLILVVSQSTQPRITILGHVDDDWVPLDDHDGATQEDIPGVLVVRVRESLNFANTGQLKERLRRLELYGPGKAHPSEAPRRDEATVLVIHAADMETIDASAIAIFSELAKSYRARGVEIYFTHLRPAPRRLFIRAGLVEFLGEDNFQSSVDGAMSSIESRGLSSGISSR